MLTNNEVFEVRSIESLDVTDESGGESRMSQSLESVVMESEGVSDAIKELILE